MLVLNRKVGESIIIGENIEVKILELTDGKVKIGIEAPQNVNIIRKEVQDQVKAENRASINTKANVLDMLNGKKK